MLNQVIKNKAYFFIFLLSFFSFVSFASYSNKSNRIFRVYTTGLGNWGNFKSDDPHNLIRRWNQSIRTSVVKQISKEFDIEFHHYDPLLGVEKHKLEEAKKIIQRNLVCPEKMIPRIVRSEFFIDFFSQDKVDTTTPYLVLDFAHLYYQTLESGKVLLAGTYGEKISEEKLSLKVLRFGFLGDNIPFLLGQTRLFFVDAKGSIRSYIDRMRERGFLSKKYLFEPSDFFMDLETKLRRKMEDQVKFLKGDAPLWKVEPILDKISNQEKRILLILKLFWSEKNYSQEEIVKNATEKLINKKKGFILKAELKTSFF